MPATVELKVLEGMPALGKTGYFLRPAIKPGKRRGEPLFNFSGVPDGDGGVFDPTYGGECVWFRDGKGCDMEFADRPLNCQGLVANPDNPGRSKNPDAVGCSAPQEMSKSGIILAWQPYSEQLERAGRQAEEELRKRGRR